jgi:hypothetical protein
MSGTVTPNLNLYKPATGEVGYDTLLNENFNTIDTAIMTRIPVPAGTPAIGDMMAWNGTAWVRVVPSANKVLIGVNGAIPSFATLLSSIMTVNANIPMAGFTLTGLPAATANGQAARYDELIAGDSASLAAAKAYDDATKSPINHTHPQVLLGHGGSATVTAGVILTPFALLIDRDAVYTLTTTYYNGSPSQQNIQILVNNTVVKTLTAAGNVQEWTPISTTLTLSQYDSVTLKIYGDGTYGVTLGNIKLTSP